MAQLNEASAPALPVLGAPMPAAAAPPPELAAAEQEIAQLTQQKAALPPMVSSYPIDDTDDHEVHSATCLDALRAPKGRALKNGTTKDQMAFENLKLHMQEHDAVIAQKAKEAAAAARAALRQSHLHSVSARMRKTCRPTGCASFGKRWYTVQTRQTSRNRTRMKRLQSIR